MFAGKDRCVKNRCWEVWVAVPDADIRDGGPPGCSAAAGRVPHLNHVRRPGTCRVHPGARDTQAVVRPWLPYLLHSPQSLVPLHVCHTACRRGWMSRGLLCTHSLTCTDCSSFSQDGGMLCVHSTDQHSVAFAYTMSLRRLTVSMKVTLPIEEQCILVLWTKECFCR